MAARPRPQTQDEYIAAAPEAVQDILRRIQQDVQLAVPDADPCISYAMPAFRKGKVFFYFAAFKHHIGVYPPIPSDSPLATKLAPYRGPKGNLSFSLAQPMPYALIEQVARALATLHGAPSRKRRKQSAA